MKPDWAKLFKHPLHGQVLVNEDTNAEGAPILRVSVLVEGHVMSAHFNFDNTFEGRLERASAFGEIREFDAIKVIDDMFEHYKASVSDDVPVH